MNEAETRAELIDPPLREAGWGVVAESRTRRELIAPGRIMGTRAARVASRRSDILPPLRPEQAEFVEFVLSQYVAEGEDELGEEKLPGLLNLKYGTAGEAVRQLGSASDIRQAFRGFQQDLYRRD